MKKFLLVLVVLSQVVAVSFATDIKDVESFNDQINKSCNLLKKYDIISDEDETLTNVYLGVGLMTDVGRVVDFLTYFPNKDERNAIVATINDLYEDIYDDRNYSNSTFMKHYATRNFQKQKDSLVWKIFYDKGFLVEDKVPGKYTIARCKGSSGNADKLGMMFTLNQLPSGQYIVTLYGVACDNSTHEIALLKKTAIVK